MPAPKNNQFGKGNHRAGRPAKFKNPEDLYQQISQYYEDLGEQRPTITGLCLHLGFSSKQSLYDYAKRQEFRYFINRALLIIEIGYEKMLLGQNPRAAIFALKNMGWTDKVEKTININPRSSPFSSTKSITQIEQ